MAETTPYQYFQPLLSIPYILSTICPDNNISFDLYPSLEYDVDKYCLQVNMELGKAREAIASRIAGAEYLQKMRDYQAEGYVEIVLALTQGKRPLRQLCTGGGKSIEQACIVRTYYEYHKKLREQGKAVGKILLVGEKNEIIVNALQQFKDIGIPVSDIGIIKAGHPLELEKPIQIASVPTLAARWKKWELMGCPITFDKEYFDVIVVEECHHAASDSTRELWRRYPKAKIVGWSATPEHKRGFVGLFDLIIKGKSQIELAHLGYQPYWDAYGLNCPAKFGKVKLSNTGDFDIKALEKEITESNALLQGDILPTWQKYVGDKYGVIPTILFARNVAESRMYTDEINKSAVTVKGKLIKAVHIDGAMGKAAIAEAIRQFVSREATFLVNCLKMTEGFDLGTYAKSLGLPLTSVGCVQDLAPTASIKKHKQKVGRARGFKWKGKLIAIYLDHWGAHKEFGSPDCPYEWSLEGEAKSKGKAVKRCPDEDCDGIGKWGCGAVDVPHDAASCPHCGFLFPIVIKDERTADADHTIADIDREAELIPISSNLLDVFEQMLAVERKPGWAIGEFISYSPDYETLLAIQQRTNGKIGDTFWYWVSGQRIAKNQFNWLPDFGQVLEILILVTRFNKENKFKGLEKNKPVHTYQSWLRCCRQQKGQNWLPSDEELREIAAACEYDPKWVFAQKKIAIRRR